MRTSFPSQLSVLLLRVLLLLVTLRISAAEPPFLTNGLVAHYPFSGNANDQSGNNNNGTPYGPIKPTLCIDRFGFEDSAYDFTGAGSIKIPDNLVPKVPFTVSMWYWRTNRTGELNGLKVLAFFGAEGSLRDSILHCNSETFLGFYTTFNTSKYIEGSGWQSSYADGFLNQRLIGYWNHIAVRIDEGYDCSYFLNGKKIKTSKIITNVEQPQLGTTGLHAHIGAYQNTYQDSDKVLREASAFIGKIDDIRIYKRALSDNELTALYTYESGDRGARVATVAAQVVNGFVVGVSVTDGGYGYTNAPTVSFTGGGGSGAKAVAQIDQDGSVTNITVIEVGKNYSSPPTVLISDPPFPKAQAYATASIANGFVVGVSVLRGGWGYQTVPSVRLVGGGGTGAKATATIDGNGIVLGIRVIEVGTGYTSAPTVLIEPPDMPTPRQELIGFAQSLRFSGLDDSLTYDLQAEDGAEFVSTGFRFAPTKGVISMRVDNDRKHRVVPLPLPERAVVMPQIVNGFIVGATIVSGGSGYTTTPDVTISDASGSGASLSPSLSNGSIVGLTVTAAGKGYSANATIRIASPPVRSTYPESIPSLKIRVLNLLPNFNYQVQKGEALDGSGGSVEDFTALEPAREFYCDLTNRVELIRTIYVR